MTQIETLAVEFSKVLHEWLGSDMKEVVRINHTTQYKGKEACASHNYCDSNMAMNEAFEKVMGRKYIFFDDDKPETEKQNEEDTNLCNAAWSLARTNQFKI